MKLSQQQRAFNATPEGQRAMFWHAHNEVAASNAQKMRELEINRLEHALTDTRNYSVAYPILAKHGFMERTPDGFKAIDPEAVALRCRELISKLRSI